MALDKTVLAALIKTLYDAMLPAGSTPASVIYTTPMAEAIVTHIGENLDSLVIRGNWNANTNTPNISATTIPGYTWIVSVAGATDLGGITTWKVGDWAIKALGAGNWARIENVDTKAIWGNIAGTLTDQADLLAVLNAKIAKTINITALNETGIADGQIALFNKTNKDIRTSSKTIVTTLGADDTTVPTSKAVKDVTDGKEPTKGADDNYVTDADAIVIGNTSGTNTGDQEGDGVTITGAGTAIDPFVGAGTVAGDYQRLGVAAVAVIDTDETLYTVPALTYIRSPKLYITNTNGGLTAKVKVAHVDGAIGALADEDYILYNDYFLPYETKIIELDGMIATDTIIITSSQLLVNFDLCGEVLAADVNMKRVDAIDIDGAGNLVDTDYVAWLTTRACKVNMLVCNRNGGDVAEVQIAYIDDNIIGSILDEERKYFTLDVNQTLFLEMDMNMEDDKVVSFRSNMANVNCIVYTVA